MQGLRFLILGSPQSKANSRMIIRNGGLTRSIKSPQARLYEELCIDQLNSQKPATEPLSKPVGVEITIWYKTKRNDLDPSIILDCMQKAGVYENDRLVEEMILHKRWDKNNPRSEIHVYEI